MFISFEGIDGTGKTTQIQAVQEYLDKSNIRYLSLREPGGTPIGEEIRRLLKDPQYGPLEAATEVFLLSASRRQLLTEAVLPAIAAGRWVLLDRYVDSTVAYQAYGRGLDLATVVSVNALATGGVLPDLTFLLDTEIAVARNRLEDRGGSETDRIEAESLDDEGFLFMERVRKGYWELAKQYNERYIRIDAGRPREAVFGDILKHIKERMK